MTHKTETLGNFKTFKAGIEMLQTKRSNLSDVIIEANMYFTIFFVSRDFWNTVFLHPSLHTTPKWCSWTPKPLFARHCPMLTLQQTSTSLPIGGAVQVATIILNLRPSWQNLMSFSLVRNPPFHTYMFLVRLLMSINPQSTNQNWTHTHRNV